MIPFLFENSSTPSSRKKKKKEKKRKRPKNAPVTLHLYFKIKSQM